MSQPSTPSSVSSDLLPAAAQLGFCTNQISDGPAQIVVRQKALIKLTNRIRQSLDWTTICQTTTTDLRGLLAADRVAIYRFNEGWSGEFVFESVGSQWVSLVEAQQTNRLIAKNVNDCSVRLLDTQKADTHLQALAGGAFAQGEVFRTCSDIYNAGFSDCYIEVLESYQARAYVIIAIYIENKLWGLLAAYQNDGPRGWQEEDINLLVQVAEQLGIALNQAEYVQTIQRQSVQLERSLYNLKQSQIQLVQSEKMAGLGQLVAGVAHEINNPVNFIYANLSHVESYAADLLSLANLCQQSDLSSATDIATLQAQAAEMDLAFILGDLPKTLSSMQVGAERIRQIVLSLRNFSRLDESDTKAVDIHEGIDSTLLILGHRLKANGDRPKIKVIKNYGDLPNVQCHPAQLNQVFMNLLANAIDALEYAIVDRITQTPKIWISTRLNETGQAEIRICDNGTGIDKDSKPRIFDHFFTTKPVGKGTGLGLAISRQIIVENHGGTLSLETPPQGTEFIISLPV